MSNIWAQGRLMGNKYHSRSSSISLISAWVITEAYLKIIFSTLMFNIIQNRIRYAIINCIRGYEMMQEPEVQILDGC